MLKRNTWLLLALFLVLAGFAIYQKYNPKMGESEKDATPSATVAPVEFLFPAEEGVVTSILIESREGQAVGAERGGDAWVLTRPFEAKAEAGSVEAAASQVTALAIVSRLDLDPADAGLDRPAYTITVGFSSGRSITAQIGDETPTMTGYYARKADGSIVVINKTGVDAILNLLSSPPYLETPTPSPMPTETPPPGTETSTPPVDSGTPTATKSS